MRSIAYDGRNVMHLMYAFGKEFPTNCDFYSLLPEVKNFLVWPDCCLLHLCVHVDVIKMEMEWLITMSSKQLSLGDVRRMECLRRS